MKIANFGHKVLAVGELSRTLRAMLLPFHGKDESMAMVYRLFEHFLNYSRADIVMNRHQLPGKRKQNKMLIAARKLVDNMPVQYVTGETFFDGLALKVNRHVLIPRPETEEMVQLTAGLLKNHPPDIIIDVGTGSGCIAISMKFHFPESRVIGVDVSKNALSLAAGNASINNLQVEFVCENILRPSGMTELPLCDLIISNPPYVTESEKRHIKLNVLDYEPHKALFVPDNDPLKFYMAICQFAAKHLSAHGTLVFEINEMFGKETVNLVKNQGFVHIELKRDFRGKERFVIARQA